MRYRIEYTDRHYCDYVTGRNEVILLLKRRMGQNILDIRKVYKSGASDSVLESYAPMIEKMKAGRRW